MSNQNATFYAKNNDRRQSLGNGQPSPVTDADAESLHRTKERAAVDAEIMAMLDRMTGEQLHKALFYASMLSADQGAAAQQSRKVGRGQ